MGRVRSAGGSCAATNSSIGHSISSASSGMRSIWSGVKLPYNAEAGMKRRGARYEKASRPFLPMP